MQPPRSGAWMQYCGPASVRGVGSPEGSGVRPKSRLFQYSRAAASLGPRPQRRSEWRLGHRTGRGALSGLVSGLPATAAGQRVSFRTAVPIYISGIGFHWALDRTAPAGLMGSLVGRGTRTWIPARRRFRRATGRLRRLRRVCVGQHVVALLALRRVPVQTLARGIRRWLVGFRRPSRRMLLWLLHHASRGRRTFQVLARQASFLCLHGRMAGFPRCSIARTLFALG